MVTRLQDEIEKTKQTMGTEIDVKNRALEQVRCVCDYCDYVGFQADLSALVVRMIQKHL